MRVIIYSPRKVEPSIMLYQLAEQDTILRVSTSSVG